MSDEKAKEFVRQKSQKMKSASGMVGKDMEGSAVMMPTESSINLDVNKGQDASALNGTIEPMIGNQGVDSAQVPDTKSAEKKKPWEVEKTPEEKTEAAKQDTLNGGFLEIILFVILTFFIIRAMSDGTLDVLYKVTKGGPEAYVWVITNYAYLLFQLLFNLIGGGFMTTATSTCVMRFRYGVIAPVMMGVVIWGGIIMWHPSYLDNGKALKNGTAQ